MQYIHIDGIIQTKTDNWIDDFLSWLESRGEYFGGGTTEVDENGEDK